MLEKMSKMSPIPGGTVTFQAETEWRARALKPERLWCGPETWHCLEGVAVMSALCRGGEGKCPRTLFCRK